MKPYDLAYYRGKLVELISYPTPYNTIMVRLTPNDPTTMVELPTSEIKESLTYFKELVPHLTGAGIGKLMENVGMDHDAATALLLANFCLEKGYDLSYSWDCIRHYIHDVMRHGAPEYPREQVYTDTIQQLCNSISLFAKCYDDA